jgi:hypothetical protein
MRMPDRRLTPRFPTAIEGSLTLLEPPILTIPATILDISDGGFQVKVERSLHIGALLSIEAHQVTLYGQVRYCCPFLGAYLVGISGVAIRMHGNELTCSVEDFNRVLGIDQPRCAANGRD